MENTKIDKVWKALKKYGINNENDLDSAIKRLQPLDISCMVSPLKTSSKVISKH